MSIFCTEKCKHHIYCIYFFIGYVYDKDNNKNYGVIKLNSRINELLKLTLEGKMYAEHIETTKNIQLL